MDKKVKIYYLTLDNKICTWNDNKATILAYLSRKHFYWSYNKKDVVKKKREIKKEQRQAWRKIKRGE